MTLLSDGGLPASVVSVNIGRARSVTWGGVTERTAIVKAPVTEPVAVEVDGLVGDEQEDQRNHGGPYHAVYAYAAEDYADWQVRLQRELPAGLFGENLTTRGIDLTNSVLGDRWLVGTAVLEICGPRIPCSTFARRMGEAKWVKRFTEVGASGCYLRVIAPGRLKVDDAIIVTARVNSGPRPVTVQTCFRALSTNPELKRLLVDVPALAPDVRADAASRQRARPGGDG